MKFRSLTACILLFSISGCSFYDVATISADVALDLFTDVNEGKGPYDDDRTGFWNYETSKCIKIEKEKREISQQLDAVEEGKDFVILPTGEKYPVPVRSAGDELILGPTRTCL